MGNVKVLGFDPGKTTGIAIVVGPELQVINAFEVADGDICEWLTNELHTHEPTHVVYEDYIQETKDTDGVADRHFPQATAKICGAIVLRCYQLQIPCVRQSRTRKPIGYRYLGGTYTKGKKGAGVHMADAAAHAAFLIKEGIRNGQQGYRFFDYTEGQRSQGKGKGRYTGEGRYLPVNRRS